MGAAMGAALVGNGHEVLWASTCRSDATRARAEAEGLLDVESLDALTARSEVVISICPPEHAAEQIASTFAAAGQPDGFRRAAAGQPDGFRQVAAETSPQ